MSDGCEGINDFFKAVEQMGSGNVRCVVQLGVILMRIDGEWKPVVPNFVSDRDFVSDLAKYTHIKIFKDSIKVFTRNHGRKVLFHVVDPALFKCSIYNNVTANVDVGVMYRRRHYDLRHIKYIKNNVYYNANFEIVYTFDPASAPVFIKQLSVVEQIVGVLIINRDYVFDCEHQDITICLGQGKVTINNVDYYYCHRQLISEHGYLLHMNRLDDYAIPYKDYIKFPALDGLCFIARFNNLFIVKQFIDFNYKFERINPLSETGKHTKIALRAPMDEYAATEAT